MESSNEVADPSPKSRASISGAKKKRPGACSRCRHRKVRCDGQIPVCGNCQKAETSCDVQNASAQRESLMKRLRYLETLVQGSQLESNTEIEASRSFQPNTVRHSTHVPNVQSPTRSLEHSNDLLQAANGLTDISMGMSLNEQPKFADFDSRIVLDHGATTSLGPSTTGTELSAISVQQPIAHEVGMLSLSNSTEPKYIGPSSGVTFARLIYAAVPEPQSLVISASDLRQGNQNPGLELNDKALLPDLRNMRRFINAYFETIHTFYPFLDERTFSNTAERIRRLPDRSTSPVMEKSAPDAGAIDHIDHAQLFLVLFLGANLLETQLSQEYRSESYLATAMAHVSLVSLHESLRGLQTLILLTLSSLHSPRGLNAWFLKSTILAGCIDLGLQRKVVSGLTSSSPQEHRLRSGVFWSAYSLDRTLSVVLGRPLTLRDEALDVEFPDGLGSEEIDHEASHFCAMMESAEDEEPPSKTQRPARDPESPATFSFRFDRIFAEIKLMLYRVAQSPLRFPWPSDFGTWQVRTHNALSRLLEHSHRDLDRLDAPNGSRTCHDNTMVSIELKHHQAVMLSYRPSPAIPRPTALALKYCFESAVGALQAQSELHRFGGFTKSWLNAHTVFVSGITICYCLWVSPQIRAVTTSSTFACYADTVKQLLTYLSSTWTVASSAWQKFEALIQRTELSLQLTTSESIPQGAASGNQTNVDDSQKSWPNISLNGSFIDDDLDWSSFDVEYESANIWPQEMLDVPEWFSLANWPDNYGSS